jgi:ligand-binding sensor domain-containing protein
MKWSLALLSFFCPLYLFCQEYGYTHYDSKDGLAGVTVYCMTQDKDGFIWIGTESGLSRFDGTHFKNFTRDDGLPDNEVIQLFADSRGRVWITPFKKSVCYYYKGKIYTPDNDPILKRLQIEDNVVRFAEDRAGNILMEEPKKLHLVDVNGHVTGIDSINSKRVVSINGICARADDGFMVIDDNRVYDYRNNRFHLKKTVFTKASHDKYFDINANAMIWRNDSIRAELFLFAKDTSISLPFKISHINFNLLDEQHVGMSTRDGATVYAINKPDSAWHFLPGLRVSNMMRDQEGNIWLSTLGHGLYKLNSSFVLNTRIEKDNIASQVFALAPYKDAIMVGT